MARNNRRSWVGQGILANLLLVAVAATPACRSREQRSNESGPGRLMQGAPFPSASSDAPPSAAAPVASASASSRPEPAGPPPAFLNGLAPGERLGPAEVVAIGAITGGRLPVEVHIGPSRGILEVALRDDEAPPPVAATERYAIYWRSGGPGTNWLVNTDLEQVAVALGQRILAAEKTSPVPAELSKFAERAKQPQLGL